MPRRYGIDYEPVQRASRREKIALVALSPLVWTLSALYGLVAGVLVVAVTNTPKIGIWAGVAVAVGFWLWSVLDTARTLRRKI